MASKRPHHNHTSSEDQQPSKKACRDSDLTEAEMASSVCRPANPYLGDLESDFLYHIGYNNTQCAELFKDVKIVVAGGSANRMKNFAERIAKEINEESKDISKTDRFAFFKIGPVLSISHGMGVPSITIMLHEILKLLHYAQAQDPVIIRMGTSGGIGVEAGTVVVSNKSFNAFLKEEHDVVILGKVVSRSTGIDQEVAREMVAAQNDTSFSTILSGTMCTDDFYEGQARMDGIVCEIDEKEKMQYLKRVNEAGISNIEMECTSLASLCRLAGVKCAVVCVTLLDRLKGDQVTITPEDYQMYQQRPQALIANFIKNRLSSSK